MCHFSFCYTDINGELDSDAQYAPMNINAQLAALNNLVVNGFAGVNVTLAAHTASFENLRVASLNAHNENGNDVPVLYAPFQKSVHHSCI